VAPVTFPQRNDMCVLCYCWQNAGTVLDPYFVRSFEEIKDQLRILTGMVQSMRQCNAEDTSLPDDIQLPLTSPEAVRQLDLLLQDPVLRRKLVIVNL